MTRTPRSRPRLPRAGAAVGLLAGWLSSAALAGQGAPGAAAVPASLTFAEAVEVALENSPTYLRQLNQVESAEYGERQSMGSLMPSLAASLSFNGNRSRNKTALDNLGRPLEEPTFVENTTSSAGQGLSGSVPLFNLQNLRDYGSARAQTWVQEAAAGAQAAELRTRVGIAYFDVVQRGQLVEVEEQTLATARDQVAAIRELLRVAARQPTDVLGAELDMARAEQSLQQARGELRKARLALRERMGVSMETPFEVADGFPDVFDPSGLTLASLVDRALRQSPRMAQQRAAVEAADRSLSAARAGRYPTLSGSYSYGRGTSARGYDALGQLDLPNSAWGFGMSVSLPLFNRFQTSAAIGRASVEEQNARESLREATLAVERETRAAVIDLENAYAGVELAERSAEIARERLRQGQEQYRLGTLPDYTALQQMIEAVAQQERLVTQARFNFAVALLTLEEKIGGTLEVGG